MEKMGKGSEHQKRGRLKLLKVQTTSLNLNLNLMEDIIDINNNKKKNIVIKYGD